MDPCQSGPPQLLRQSLGMRVDSKHDWNEIARDAQLANEIAERVPVLKAAKLNEVGGQSRPQTLAVTRSHNLAFLQRMFL